MTGSLQYGVVVMTEGRAKCDFLLMEMGAFLVNSSDDNKLLSSAMTDKDLRTQGQQRPSNRSIRLCCVPFQKCSERERAGCGLQSRPDDSRLWCALGDLELRDDHYRTAWERSGCRSARAQRSLARAADIRKDWPKVQRSHNYWALSSLQLSRRVG